MYLAVDAFGGDNAPYDIVKGVVDAINEKEGFNIYLVGDEAKLRPILSEYKYDESRIEIVHATDVITMEDHPATAMRSKPDSSLARAFDLVAEKKADAIISAGSTGAILSGAIFKVKRIKGVMRPALAPFIPCLYDGEKSQTLMLDVGANADCKAEYLVQFANMASSYMSAVYGKENPSVGLINIGSEESKGSELVKEVHAKLKEQPINFVGNVESREIPTTDVDILVTDGFTGNVIIKFMEGMAAALLGEVKSAMMGTFTSKIGAMLTKPQLKNMKKKFDSEEIGAAILLGVNGGVFKCHGNSGPKAIKNGIFQAYRFVDGGVIEAIKSNLKEVE